MKVGIDLGGTKTEAILIDRAGNEVNRIRQSTSSQDYHAIVSSLVAIKEKVSRQCIGPVTIGIGIPGIVSAQTNLVKNANTTCLIGKPLQKDLEQALGQPVRIANDANCFTLSEATDGAGRGHEAVFGVILGTGVGGGLAVNQQVISGANGIAGEWGHNSLPWATEDDRSEPCYCGKRGCIETFLSGPALAGQYYRSTGEKKSAKQLFETPEGDTVTRKLLETYCHRLARALASVVNIFDPGVIVLGGGLSNISALYTMVPPLLKEFVFSDTCQTRLLPNQHGDSSGVRGAAWLW